MENRVSSDSAETPFLLESFAERCFSRVRSLGEIPHHPLNAEWQQAVAHHVIACLDKHDCKYEERMGFFTTVSELMTEKCPLDDIPTLKETSEGDVVVIFSKPFAVRGGVPAGQFRCLRIKLDTQGPVFSTWNPSNAFVANDGACSACNSALEERINPAEAGPGPGVGCDSQQCMGKGICTPTFYVCTICGLDVCPTCAQT